VAPRVQIVQRVEHQLEVAKPADVELIILDVGVMRNDFDVGVELPSSLLCDLDPPLAPLSPAPYRSSYQSLGLLDVLMPEEELSVEIREVDRVEVDNVDFAKAGEGEVLEELASDATSSNHENAGLPPGISDRELIEQPCR
jgi:hypothetical protein